MSPSIALTICCLVLALSQAHGTARSHLPDSTSIPEARVTRSLAATTKLPNIAIVTTGGTIASVKDANGVLIPAVGGAQLIAAVPGLGALINVTGIFAAARIDSSTATPGFWVNVSKVVLQQLNSSHVDGVMLFHGTDSIEQTAWFLQCIDGIGNQRKPVVLTGSMQGADSPFADGSGNIYSASVVVGSSWAKGQGVLVAFAQQVFSSRYVTKMDASLNNAFGSVNGGSRLASVVGTDIVGAFKVDGPALCPAPKHGGFPLPAVLRSVALQASYPGADGSVLPFYLSKGNSGVVIDGLGSGNIGPGLAEGVAAVQAKSHNFKFIVTRTPANGLTERAYGCQGCLGNLTNVVQALNLDPFRARIVAMLALTSHPTISVKSLQAVYDKITYPKK